MKNTSVKPIEYIKIPSVSIRVNKEMASEFEGKITGLGFWNNVPGSHRVEVDMKGAKLTLMVHNNRMMELPLAIGDSVKGYFNPKDNHIWRIEKA